MKKIILILLVLTFSFGSVAEIAAKTKNFKPSRGKRQAAAEKNRRSNADKNRLKSRRGRQPRRYVAKNTAKRVERIKKEQPVALTSPDKEPVLFVPPAADETVELPKSKLEKHSDETLGGNMVVDVSANSNTVIKIGLAERGVALIDFPRNDSVYKIHPGNENFVTVGCFGREPTGKCLDSPSDAIVLRPGKDFHALGTEESAATVITIQRVSGIVVTLLVVPVKKISENTNYVAIRYQLDEVLKTRRESGLATNMLSKEVQTPNSSMTANGAATTSGSISGVSDSQIIDAALSNSAEVASATDPGQSPDAPLSLDQTLINEVQRVAQNNPPMRFSKPVYGIVLARASGYTSRTGDVTIEIVAVRNTLPSAIRLVPEQPELVIENRDSKETSINVQKVAVLNIATNADDSDVLQPGQIYYYAFAYESPILGVKQVLRVSFAQREASDAPASIILSANNR